MVAALPPPPVVARVAVGGVHAYGGWLAWLRPGPTRGRYRVVVMSPRGVRRVPKIAPLRRVADFDLGTDGKGRAALVITRCAAAAGSCDLSLVSLSTSREQRIGNASLRGVDERKPTLWGGRLAWTRTAPGRRPVILTRRLSWPRSRPSRRLPGVTKDMSGASVDGLDLGAAGLAENLHFDNDEAGICGQGQIQVVSLSRPATVRVLRSVTCGLSGQTLYGPAIARGWVGWLMSCLGDPGGCVGTGGALRLRLRDNRLERIATTQRVGYYGYALSRSAAYAVQGRHLVFLAPRLWRRHRYRAP